MRKYKNIVQRYCMSCGLYYCKCNCPLPPDWFENGFSEDDEEE